MIASIEIHRPELLDVVALVHGRPELGLAVGAVGTVVEELDDATALVEFAEETGEALTIVACPHHGLRTIARA